MCDYHVLLVVGDRQWTEKALHLACVMARSNGGCVTLIKMAPVGHPALLGSPEGSRFVDQKALKTMEELAGTADKYGVPVQVAIMQFATYGHALVDAAEQLGAAAVFASLPASHIPYWSRFQQWRVKRSLARGGRTLHTLQPSGGPLEWLPSTSQTLPAHSTTRGKESR